MKCCDKFYRDMFDRCNVVMLWSGGRRKAGNTAVQGGGRGIRDYVSLMVCKKSGTDQLNISK